jgi:hypothetical protein
VDDRFVSRIVQSPSYVLNIVMVCPISIKIKPTGYSARFIFQILDSVIQLSLHAEEFAVAF